MRGGSYPDCTAPVSRRRPPGSDGNQGGARIGRRAATHAAIASRRPQYYDPDQRQIRPVRAMKPQQTATFGLPGTSFDHDGTPLNTTRAIPLAPHASPLHPAALLKSDRASGR
jgi:hypothetical protein